MTNFISRNKAIAFLSIAIYLIGLMAGPTIIIKTGGLSEGVSDADAIDPSKLGFQSVFKNNAIVAVSSISGACTFGISTASSGFINGLSHGVLFAKGLNSAKAITILALTIPHSVLELPALWLAGAAGFKVPYEVIRYLMGRKEYILNRRELKDYVYLSVASVVLIVVAAWVEANVTMRIAESMT